MSEKSREVGLELEIPEITFAWVISQADLSRGDESNNNNNNNNNNESLSLASPTFATSTPARKFHWNLTFCLAKDRDKDIASIGLYLYSDIPRGEKIQVDCAFYCIYNGNQTKASRVTMVFERCSPIFSSCLSLDRRTIIGGDGLIVLCNVTHEHDSRSSRIDELERAMADGKYADVRFSVGGTVLPAHKFILAARSPVFEEMFENQEAGQEVIVVEDVSPEVFNEVLRYAYVGKVNGIERHAEQLLKAAERFSLRQLKAMCEESICRSVSRENAAECFKLAERCNALELKNFVTDFIFCHARDVLDAADRDEPIEISLDPVYEVTRAYKQLHIST